MRTLGMFVSFVAVTSPTHLLGRRLESTRHNHYNDFELVAKAFLADNGEAPVKLPIFETVYTKSHEDEFNKIIRKSVDAFTPFIKGFAYKISKEFDVPFYTAAESNTTIVLPKASKAESRTVTVGYNFEDNTETVMNNNKRKIGIEAQVESHSVFKSFCYPPVIAFTNLTVSDDVRGVFFTSELSSPCKQTRHQWDQSYVKVESIDKYTDCQYVVAAKMKSTDVYLKLTGKLSGLSTGTVKLGVVIKNQIPSKLRLSVNRQDCVEKKSQNNGFLFSHKDAYICLENGYWKDTQFYIKDCSVYDTNTSASQQKQICNAYKKVFSTVNIKSLQSLYNYQFPQKLPKCYSSSEIRRMVNKH